jgi:hypothetical protein
MKHLLHIRFLEIYSELQCFQQYLDTVEKYLALVDPLEWKRALEKLRKKKVADDPDEYQAAFLKHIVLTEELLPRFFLNPLLLTLWAIYESAIIEIADYLRTQKNEEQTLDKTKARGGFLGKAKKYFKRILSFPLCPDNKMWQELTTCMKLRNAIAHGNGRLEAIKEESREKIIEIAGKRSDISISGIANGYLVISPQFLRTTYDSVNRSLEELIDRVLEEYPPTSWW